MKFGLLGKNISYSLSPILHQVFADQVGVILDYDLLDLEKISIPKSMTIIDYLQLNQYNGVNVTIPLKEELLDEVDVLSEEAERIGSINTILLKDGITEGFNTDHSALERLIIDDFVDIEIGGTFLIKGAGGFARSAAFALGELENMHVYVVNRDYDRALELEEWLLDNDIKAMALEERDLFEDGVFFDGLLNATPIGMGESIEMPFDIKMVKSAKWCIESVYAPKKTMFIDMAYEAGNSLISGLSLLFHQGADAFEIWTGRLVDRKAAWILFLERIK